MYVRACVLGVLRVTLLHRAPTARACDLPVVWLPHHVAVMEFDFHVWTQSQNQNQIYSLEQYTVIPTATYSFVPPGCRTGRLAAAFPRPHVSGRLAPAAAWAVWPWSLTPVCSLPRVCYLSIAILDKLSSVG